MVEISELLPPLPKPARFDYDHGADMGTPVYSEAQMRKYALDTIRRAEARQARGEADAGHWFDLTGDARLGGCATDGCGGQPTVRLEAGGIGTNYCSGCAAKIRSRQAPLPAGTVTEEMWLVTNGPDGQCSKIVVGFDNLKREVIATIFGSDDDETGEAQDIRDRLEAPDEWDGDRWSISWTFEDGYLNVQRITHISALEAAFAARPAAEPVAVKVKPLDEVGYRAVAQTNTDGAAPPQVLAAVLGCALSWEPDARIIGNVRAGDIVRALATPPVPDSVVEALTAAKDFIALEYAESGQEQYGEWLAPEARKVFGLICEALSSITETGGAK